MKKRLLALGLLIACLGGVSAQTPPPPQQKPEAWAEKLFGPAENLVHDFGTVPYGTQLHHDFVITNIYDVPIEITSIRASVGCVTATPNKKLLQPNEKAIIHVKMDGRLFKGYRTQAIYVTFGPTSIATARLTLTALSRDDIAFDPGEAAFGVVYACQTPSPAVEIVYTGQLDWRVLEVIVPKEGPFEATAKELNRRSGRVGYQVVVSIKKDAAPGLFRQTLFLKTNDPSGGLISLVVSGNVYPDTTVLSPDGQIGELTINQKTVKIGMEIGEVRKLLGEPQGTSERNNEVGGMLVYSPSRNNYYLYFTNEQPPRLRSIRVNAGY